MGYWRSKHGVIGDGPPDALDAVLDGILTSYFRAFERAPSQGELAGFIAYARLWVKEDARQGVFGGCGDKGLQEESTEGQGRAEDEAEPGA